MSRASIAAGLETLIQSGLVDSTQARKMPLFMKSMAMFPVVEGGARFRRVKSYWSKW